MFPPNSTTGLRRPSLSDHCHNWLRHWSRKAVSYRTVFNVGDQLEASLWETTEIRSGVSLEPPVLPAQIKLKSFESTRNSFSTRGPHASCLHACFDAVLLSRSYWYPNLSGGADSVGGQLRGDEDSPVSGVTSSGRIWRKVPESDAQSVCFHPSTEQIIGLQEIRSKTQKGLHERLFILTRIYSMQIFGGIPFAKPQNDTLTQIHG